VRVFSIGAVANMELPSVSLHKRGKEHQINMRFLPVANQYVL